MNKQIIKDKIIKHFICRVDTVSTRSLVVSDSNKNHLELGEIKESTWKGRNVSANSVLAHNKITLMVDTLCQNQLTPNLIFQWYYQPQSHRIHVLSNLHVLYKNKIVSQTIILYHQQFKRWWPRNVHQWWKSNLHHHPFKMCNITHRLGNLQSHSPTTL